MPNFMLGMLVTVRRGTQNKTENIIMALNKLIEHPHLQIFVWLVFLCSFYHQFLHLGGKKKDWERCKVANIIQGLQQFLYSSRLLLYTVKKKLCGGNLGYRLLKLWVSTVVHYVSSYKNWRSLIKFLNKWKAMFLFPHSICKLGS